MKRLWKVFSVLALALVILSPGMAKADYYTPFTFYIGVPNAALSGFTAPYLEVTITETTPITATFDIKSLTNGNYLYLMGGSSAFGANFNLGTGGSVAISGDSGIAWNNMPTISDGGAGNVDGFGVFNKTINFSDGYTSALSKLTFTATLTGTTWSDAASVLIANADGYLAGGHIFVQDTTNKSAGALVTGYAANGAVPIPPSALLLGSGLIGLGLISWRRKTKN